MLAHDLAPDLFSGGGEMGALMSSIDWSQTPLGAVEQWSASLRTMVKVLLANRFPLLLWWGADQCQLYNDAYRPVLGSKHPQSIGQPARECWPEIWHILAPLILTPYGGGPPTWDDDLFLELNRHGFLEETHFTVAYSPVPDDSVPGGIGGVLATVHEITRQVVEDRRMAALRDLSARSSEAKTPEAACHIAAEAFGRHARDVPFALLYLLESPETARLAGVAGIARGSAISPEAVDLATDSDGPWPFAEIRRSEAPQLVEHLQERYATTAEADSSSAHSHAFVLPVPSNVQHRLAGFVVMGITPRLAFDERYRSFCELATAQVATAIANAQAFDEERRRAEALAELDRAKTTFFSNVSHEFRTPLTLLLGPLEELLAAGDHSSSQHLEVAHRNALRLQRLVNTLLDFSRIEAGRIQATYVPIDLPAYTADLASSFRSAVEQAGMRLIVDCQRLSEPVYVDQDMWEKIVLNLLSNAFKFTFDGEIRVSLLMNPTGDGVELAVQDTGVGISAQDLPRVFERFHRVPGTRARTHEGTGIGLALVQELARLHGGAVRVESAPGVGTTFVVTVPTGTDHLPPAQIKPDQAPRPTTLAAAPYLEEALRWLPDTGVVTPVSTNTSTGIGASERGGRVLIVDDNADMREYLARLLAPYYATDVAPDGLAALEIVATRAPDLVLTDIMMPGLDGVGLLHALREQPRTADIPIILVSARAGDEAKILGLASGADDYLVKPFAAAELLARVSSHLRLAQARARVAEAERHAAAEALKARDAAQEALLARDLFFSAAAHELRTPVATIKATAQLMLRKQSRGLLGLEQVEAAFTSIVSVADRLTALTSDLLDISRLQSGLLTLRRAPVDVVDLVGTCVDRARLLDDSHSLHVSAPAGPVWLSADAARLEQVLDNALSNAIKYSPAASRIDIGLETDGHEVSLRVKDEGIGLAPGLAETLFEPFERGPRAVEEGIPGFGLGLFISRRIVELHGGHIWADSSGEGMGTTLQIWLPIADENDPD